jgi:hypothetical protein
MQDPIAVQAIPFGFGVRDDRRGHWWVMAALVPALVACVAKNDDVAGGPVTAEAVFAKSQLLSASIHATLDLRVILNGGW